MSRDGETDSGELVAGLAMSDSRAAVQDSAVEAPTFPQFGCLPQELQDAIWQATISSIPPRILEGFVRTAPRTDTWDGINMDVEHEWTFLVFRAAPALPAPLNVLHACRDARRVAQECGWTLAFPEPSAEGSAPGRCAWFRPQTDLLFVNTEGLGQLTNQAGLPTSSPVDHDRVPYAVERGLDLVQHVAVHWWVFAGLDEGPIYSSEELKLTVADMADPDRAEREMEEREKSRLLDAVDVIFSTYPATRTIYVCVCPDAVPYHGTEPLEDENEYDGHALHAALMAPEDFITTNGIYKDAPWGVTKAAIEEGFASDWMREFVKQRFWDRGVVVVWPPRLVGLWVARGGDVLRYRQNSDREERLRSGWG